MSILIIRKSESPRPNGDAIPQVVVAQLVSRAAQANRALAIRTCLSDDEVAAALQQANAQHAEFLLFDPGSAPSSDDRYGHLLERLRMPCIEVHDDRAVQEPDMAAQGSRVVARIHGYGFQSYTAALNIALERLGCAECENNYHVGT